MSVWLGAGRNEGDPFGVGYADDAKKELDALLRAGHISNTVPASKPSRLMVRLIALFSAADGRVVDIGSPAGEMAAMATATGRHAIHVSLPGAALDSVVIPRLELASRGHHPIPSIVDIADGSPSRTEDIQGFAFKLSGHVRSVDDERSVARLELGRVAAVVDRKASSAIIQYDQYPAGSESFFDALANLEGLVPLCDPTNSFFASSLDGAVRAAYVPSRGYLDVISADRLVDEHTDFLDAGGSLRIYFHRGDDSCIETIRSDRAGLRISARRIPFDLQIAAALI